MELAAAWRALGEGDPAAALRDGLSERLGCERLQLYRSGREALRVAFQALAGASGRDEVVIPAYTCYSVPAAAVAAGMRVRLVDVTPRGALDSEALAALPLARVAAVVVCNLLGLPEAIEKTAALAEAAGAAVIDDAAQSLGAHSAGKPVGGRATVGLLSFGRGKPLSGLGGGALAWSPSAPAPAPPPEASPSRGRALTRLLVHGVARRPAVFRWLSAIPALGIGETHYDPEFPRGGIEGAALPLAAAALPGLEARNRARAARAEALGTAITDETSFEPLLAEPGCRPAFPRLGVLAPDREAREAALRELRHLGASRLYPAALDALGPLAPHLCEGPRPSVAAGFAERLLTLPSHGQLDARRADEIVERLAEISRRHAR